MYHVNKDAVCFDHGLFHSEMIWSHYSPSASSLPHGFTASDRGGIFPSFRPTSCSGRAKKAEPEDGIAGREKVPTPYDAWLRHNSPTRMFDPNNWGMAG